MTAPTRFTSDSIASDMKPTEPVSTYAAALSAIVTTAAAMESQAKRTSDLRGMSIGWLPLAHHARGDSSRARAYVAARPLKPTSPITFGNTWSAFIRSPQAQTTSGLSTAPNGISRQ